MVDNLQVAFDRLTEKYIHRVSSSDEEIAVEYQLPTPSRKHKIKTSESPSRHKRKKRKSHEHTGEPKSSSSEKVEKVEEKENDNIHETGEKKSKESHKNKRDKIKKKRKGHHRHGKHSKNHKKNHKSNHGSKKHNKKQRHGKDKDRESRKSKLKKKKSKHHDNDPPQVLKHSISQESLESSNRSRSASPLPSIHTPSPSPTELDKVEQNNDTEQDFMKDKFDKIKERRRHANKEAWDSLFETKQKSESHKHNVGLPGKDKNHKLRETIEKLKAKNEKYKDATIFNSIFTAANSENSSQTDSSTKGAKEITKNNNEEQCPDTETGEKVKVKATKRVKKSSAKNESASEALEQAVKDISMWLTEPPKGSVQSSPCDSPAQTISTEDHDSSRLDDELSQGEKLPLVKKDVSRKRPSSREPKVVKRREIQRTIDRLQPGKSKGNLLTNMTNKNTEKVEETVPSGTSSKTRDTGKPEESSPKLSLGSVLPTVEFTLGNDHNFSNDESNKIEVNKEVEKITEVVKEESRKEEVVENKPTEIVTHPTKKDAEVETDPQIITKPSQEKATPNLSAWFKAFGAPKATPIATVPVKKKIGEVERDEKSFDITNAETVAKMASPKCVGHKFESPNGANSPLPDGGDSPLLNVTATRQRRTSTGSSISERSSFSQDLDSPRHLMSHNSPLLHSPASPRAEDFQKITYPIINGTVRAGFYQDTTLKSSPEKSCSPREGPQSPFSPYSQHVYATNNSTGSVTPSYFADHNKSPLPTYGQNAPPYYDTSKAPVVTKPGRVHDDYTALGPDTFNKSHYTPAAPTQSTYSQSQASPQPTTASLLPPATPNPGDPKNALFPVKKRSYNEPDQNVPVKTATEQKDPVPPAPVKTDFPKMPQVPHPIQTMSSTSVDDIALALSEKSEMAKLNNLRDKNTVDDTDSDRLPHHTREPTYDEVELIHDSQKDVHIVEAAKPLVTNKKENIDMINMGYLTADTRRASGEHSDIDFTIPTKTSAIPQQKGFEIEAIAINLGINNQHLSKPVNKQSMGPTNMTPAHTHERTPSDICVNQTIAHAHQNQYDHLPTSPAINNFSLNDIELANKKLYTATSTAAIDYGNWKMTNPTRKPEVLPSDYSNVYIYTSCVAATEEKLKASLDSSAASTALNYNKNILQTPYNYNNASRPNIARTQDLQQNHPADIRIPNPRGLLKSDTMSTHSSVNDELAETLGKNVDALAKSQKPEKHVQNHPLVSSLPYKTPYSSHSTLPMETLRNLSNIPQMLERYTNDERYLQSLASGTSLYHDKTFQMAQMFNKSIASEIHPASTSVGIYSQPSIVTSKDNNIYKTANVTSSHPDSKKTSKRKKTLETKQAQIVSSHLNIGSSCNSEGLASVKTSMMPSSPFNFGTTTNMALGSMYGDNGGFSMDDFRNSSHIMAANYMAAAVARQHRTNEVNPEKIAKPAHQNSNHSTGAYPFLSSQIRAAYPFVGTETSSPLYQQYFQRYQEELQRQTGAQIMGLYPPTYPTSLGVRQPYDSINRPSWL